MTAPIRCDAVGCAALPCYVVGGGAAAEFTYCETHARDLCACDGYLLGTGGTGGDIVPEDALGNGEHQRDVCYQDGRRTTRSAGTPGGSLMHNAGGQ